MMAHIVIWLWVPKKKKLGTTGFGAFFLLPIVVFQVYRGGAVKAPTQRVSAGTGHERRPPRRDLR